MNIQNFHRIRYEAFKTQDQELGNFDVTFDIGGKKLFAHKFMLTPISTTFASMMSERWTSKDQPIPIETYSYDDFYQFTTFLYSGECQLTNDNIVAMVDIAEFYQVSDFKDACDEYLSKLECSLENYIQLLEIASKYSIAKLKQSLASFIELNRGSILNPELFSQISKETLLQIVELDPSTISSEYVFQKVYDWAEMQAMTKKEVDSNLNPDATVKEMLTDFMPLFDFSKMDHCFLLKYLVGKSLLPPGPRLCEILMKSCGQTMPQIFVKITDENGKTMRGRFCDPGNIYDEIQKLKNVTCGGSNTHIYWATPHQNLRTQNRLKKYDGIEWYLIYEEEGYIAVKRRNQIDDLEDYLIAEMFAENGFVLSNKCKIVAISF